MLITIEQYTCKRIGKALQPLYSIKGDLSDLHENMAAEEKQDQHMMAYKFVDDRCYESAKIFKEKLFTSSFERLLRIVQEYLDNQKVLKLLI